MPTSAQRSGGGAGLERHLHGVGDQLRGDNAPAEQHAADDPPGVKILSHP
jgi:hypothetical protein